MTVDVVFVDVDEAPQGNNLNYSIISSDEEDPVSLKVKLKVSAKNKVPVVVLKKKDNSNEFIVTRRTPKPKKFDDYETEFSVGKAEKSAVAVSPRKRKQSKLPHGHESPTKKAVEQICKTLTDDLKLFSPVKVHIENMNLRQTPSRTSKAREQQTERSARLSRMAKQNLNFNEDAFYHNFCESFDNVNVSSSKKRNASKPPTEDDGLITSPKKRGRTQKNESQEKELTELLSTTEKQATNGVNKTPRRSGRPIKTVGTPQNQENELKSPISDKKRTRTPTRQEEHSHLRLVKKNLNESFRTKIWRQVLQDSTVSNRTCNSEVFMEDDSPKKIRETRHRTGSTSSDVSEESVDFTVDPKKVSATPTRVLRSRSVSLSSNQSEDSIDYSPKVSRTSSRRKTISSNQSKEEYVLKTPNRRKTQAYTPKSVAPSTPKTPRNRMKLIREGVLTPSMQSRKSTVPANTTPLMKARNQLHVSYVPTDLPCREKEYLNVYNFLKGKLLDGCGGCMYVSGVPGTGKTATVTSVIDRLQSAKGVPKFSYVVVNGMRLTEPKQAYVEIWKQLTGKTRPWEQAQSLLEERFTKKGNLSPVIMLIDELDILCTKRQDVVYNLLDWPSKSRDQLIVITIANTMDLPERLLMNKVTSRLGLTRLTFQPYNHKQLMEIVTKRLTGTDSFNPDAVQLVSRKVASVSGDARRALDICRRAAEIAEEEGKAQLVSITHVDQALNAMITQPKVMAMKRCSRLEKLVLQAIVAEVERTGVEETTFADVFKMLVSCCALDGFKMVSSTVAQRAVCQLSSCRLILTDQKCSDIFQKIILNVSVDEVYFALKK